jgi:CheY-like chemotaxis protein
VARASDFLYLANVCTPSSYDVLSNLFIVCQLHGGDIGVSSKEGDGSTFGFFFKVRQSDGTSEDGRPPFSSRSNSENTQSPQPTKTPRPGYSRANSNLRNIKETREDKPPLETLRSHSGIDPEVTHESLKNPPTEYFAESHPESTEDDRYRETERAVDEGPSPPTTKETRQQRFDTGESKRQGDAANEAHKSKNEQPSESKRTLLLVEDNMINQKVLRRQLQSRGYEVFVANNGQEAIDAVSERGQVSKDDPNNRNYFDCILMDQEMPIKDGNAATAEIRELEEGGKAGHSKILGVSANVRESQRQSMREAGMDDLISKPYKVEDLVKKVDKLIVKGEGELQKKD